MVGGTMPARPLPFGDPLPPTARIRNFCIVAHIDHGKSTLADRLLERCGAVSDREMREQMLDSMDLERERGITIKAQAVRLRYLAPGGEEYTLNLIDTPGHVDFTYEVSRSLAACEGAVLLVDATQGVEAQTLANAFLAIEGGLEVIPVVNKIDLAAADADRVAEEIAAVLGVSPDDVLRVSAKSGAGVEELLEAIVARVPPPRGRRPTRCGPWSSTPTTTPTAGWSATSGCATGVSAPATACASWPRGRAPTADEVGVLSPRAIPVASLGPGEVGYLITGVKEIDRARVGDTVTRADRPASVSLPGYREPKPMVFSGLYPSDGDEFEHLREALEKLRLNDAALSFEPETSRALGFGFRCGFLGLLHMEIVRERLEREYDLDLVATAPSVGYRVVLPDGSESEIRSPQDLPEFRREIQEPYVRALVITPTDLHRHRHGAAPGAPRRARDHAVPDPGAGGAGLPGAAGGDRVRLLRPPRSRPPGATPRSTTSTTATGRPTWPGWTSCSTGCRSTPSRPSCTARRPTPTAAAWSTACAASSPGRCSTCPSRRPSGRG